MLMRHNHKKQNVQVFFTPSGITIDCNLTHWLNVYGSMFFTKGGIVIVVRFFALLKAKHSIFFTVLQNVMVSRVEYAKADSPIVVTLLLLFIITFRMVDLFLKQSY